MIEREVWTIPGKKSRANDGTESGAKTQYRSPKSQGYPEITIRSVLDDELH
jgi:hypothetical protein